MHDIASKAVSNASGVIEGLHRWTSSANECRSIVDRDEERGRDGFRGESCSVETLPRLRNP
jgi:hypothetical protein